ncbi:MAG: hypothetical protein PF541_16545 [Prolixibacteraceae bacterium]|nr:hypothetical protein [Prolixibacteraceae bacterium]
MSELSVANKFKTLAFTMYDWPHLKWSYVLLKSLERTGSYSGIWIDHPAALKISVNKEVILKGALPRIAIGVFLRFLC